MKNFPNGSGPGLSLYIRGQEVLRFDIFGPGAGHYHMHVNEQEKVKGEPVKRLALSGDTRAAQVRAAIEIIATQSPRYLSASSKSAVREFVPDPQRFHRALALAEKRLLWHCGNLTR